MAWDGLVHDVLSGKNVFKSIGRNLRKTTASVARDAEKLLDPEQEGGGIHSPPSKKKRKMTKGKRQPKAGKRKPRKGKRSRNPQKPKQKTIKRKSSTGKRVRVKGFPHHQRVLFP